MELSLSLLRLSLFVLQTTGKTDVNGQLMPRYFEAKERPLATSLFKRIQEVAAALPQDGSEEGEVSCSQEEKDLLLSLLDIPLAMQDSLLAEELISLLKKDNV